MLLIPVTEEDVMVHPLYAEAVIAEHEATLRRAARTARPPAPRRTRHTRRSALGTVARAWVIWAQSLRPRPVVGCVPGGPQL
jgi:hypothetical protein